MQSIKCSECGLVSWASSEMCKQCGATLTQGGSDYQVRNRHMLQRDLKKGLAIASLVIGVINLFTLGFFLVGAILGIVLSLIAMSRAKEHPLVYGGRDLAIGGLITSALSLVLLVPIGLIAAISIPNLLAARRAANEGSTMASLRTIHSAEATYQATAGNGSYGTLEQLAAQNLIRPELASGTRNGYRFSVEVTSDLDSEMGFQAVAIPLSYPSSGRRSFFVDESGVIRAADTQGREATKYDPALDNAYDRDYSYEPPPRRSGYQQQPGY